MRVPHVSAFATVACSVLLMSIVSILANARSVHALARSVSSPGQSIGMPAAREVGILEPERQVPTPTPRPRRLPSILALGVGGGDAPELCRFFPRRVDEPAITARWWASPRTYDICLMGFPEGADVVATATDAQGSEFTRRFTVGTPVAGSDDQGTYAVTVLPVDLLWPGDVPGGTWHVTVSADGRFFDETLDVPEAEDSSFGAQFRHSPAAFRNPLRASAAEGFNCVLEYSYYPGDSLTIAASGFPALMRDLEVGIYGPGQSNLDAGDSMRLSHWIAGTDAGGSFELQYKIPKSSVPGIYWIVAPEVPEPDWGPNYISNCFVVARPGSQGITEPEAAAVPQAAMAATVLRNANLRAGPGTNFARIGVVRAGSEIAVVGTNPAGTWYQLDSGAWIAAFLVRLER